MMFRYLFYVLIFLSPTLNNVGGEVVPKKDLLIKPKPKKEKPDVYSALKLSEYGLSPDAYRYAMKGYKKLRKQGKLDNPDIITIVDFSQSSKNKRLYVIDLKEQKLLFNTWVSHGKNTGDEFAQNFSNINGSLKSSLGFYITKNTNIGATVGFSLIMEGLEKGVNDNAIGRQIIMHGANYATEEFIHQTGRLGRSFGCPAIPPKMTKPIVNTIRDGSVLFIYYPDDNYIKHSALLSEA